MRALFAATLACVLAACSEPAPSARVEAPRPPDAPRPTVLDAALTRVEVSATPPVSDAPLALAPFAAVGPAGETTAIAVRYALPASITARYAPIERGLHLIAVRAQPEPRAWIAPLSREGALSPAGTEGEAASGALVVDPRALLGLPGDEAEYAIALWIEDRAVTRRVRLPASERAIPGALEPPLGVVVSELSREVGAAPVIRPTPGCLSFAVDVASGDEPLVVAMAAPELARARALALQRPHGYAPSIAVQLSACDAFLPLPEERLSTFVLAMRGDAIATAALDPALPPPSARPIAIPSCNEDDECVLVNAACPGVTATHRDVASAVDAIARQNQRVRECAEPPVHAPVRAVCRARVCTTERLDYPEWRTCRRDSDCTTEFRHCHQWEPIAERSAADARAAWVGAECPSIVPMPPEVRCVYGSCALNWTGH